MATNQRANESLTLSQLAGLLANARFAEVKVIRTKDLPAGKAVLVDAVIMIGEGTDLISLKFTPDDRALLKQMKVTL